MDGNINNLIHDIGEFIRQGLLHRINNIPIAANIDVRFSETQYCCKNNLVSIDSNIPFNSSTTHLPQTRIFVTTIENEYIHFVLIQYYNITVLIVEKLSNFSGLTLEIHSSINNIHKIEERDINVFCIDKNLNNRNILSYFNEIYEKEKEIHPLKSIKSRNAQLFSNIDNFWANIDAISFDGKILESSNFFWIQEIFLHFYKIKELQEFYVNNTQNKSLSIDKLRLSQMRFDAVVNKKSSNNNINLQNEDILREYIFNQTEKNELYLLIQSSWRDIAYPAKDFFFAKRLNDNPDEFISLLFLAVKENFYWHSLLFNKIKRFLKNKDLINIVSLLYILKQHSNLWIKNDVYYFSAHNRDIINDTIYIPSRRLYFSFSKQYGKYLTKLSFDEESHFFNIDKNVVISYRVTEKILKVDALIYHPPIKPISFKTVEIEIKGIILLIPLIWRRFTIKLNSCRIKFILKKKKWQLSFKLDENVKNIFIDKKKVNINNKRYFTILINNKREQSISELCFTDNFCIPLSAVSKINKPIFLRGIGLDRNGTLLEKFNLLKNNSKKSLSVYSNKYISESINQAEPTINYIVTASKFNSEKKFINNESGIISAIRYTPTAILKHKLVILTNNSDKNMIKMINNMFFNYLNFYPIIKPFNSNSLKKLQFYIVVDKATNHVVNNYTCGLPVISIDKSKMAVLLNHDNFEKEIITFFTCI